ncbi:hypothetical protein, partial [Actinomadura sp. CNU-125]|uniref:hypothetical protein n=1 Tax=Actinomadura sp. CNU-125 TaxID=1904961 RepID=UPI0021CC5948
MIVTLTLNPSLDRTIEVDALTRGAVLRARSARLDPGGKGVNVSRALLANGTDSTAVLTVGGATASSCGCCCRPRASRPGRPGRRAHPLQRHRRRTGRRRHQAERARRPALGRGAGRGHRRRRGRGGGRGGLGGGLRQPPAGRPRHRLRGAVPPVRGGRRPRRGRHQRSRAARGRRAGPDLVKPNLEELAEAVGGPVGTIADAVEAAGELRARV